MASMTSRERILTVGRRQQPDRVPRNIAFERGMATTMRRHLGTDDLSDYFNVDLYHVGINPTGRQQDFSRYFTRPGVTWDEWGCGRVWDETSHYAEFLYPLERAESMREIEEYPWPDLDASYRFDGLADRVAELHARGKGVAGSLGSMGFELGWQLRSMDRLFEDMLSDDPMATALLDRISARMAVVAREFARANVDILLTGDDVAMQQSLMMSRDLFNTWLRPGIERVFRAAREVKPDIIIWFHSDGVINDLVPDLIEMGMDMLNPVQPECVDHRWVKAAFGDRISFSGGLGVQSVLPFGTPDAVRAHVRETIETLGAGGGLLIGPSHVLERDTPLVNILAMAEAMETYGYYKGA